MSKRKNNKNKSVRPDKAWSGSDRQAFADRNILRAQTIQGRRFEGAEIDEWDDLLDDEWDF